MAQTEMLVSLVEKPTASVAKDFSDDVYDACSICLESFESGDPATVTSCNHEYHLQCILEWSQRSKECPICWQSFILKDEACQELLAAVEVERNVRTRRAALPTILQGFNDDSDDGNDSSYSDDSDFEERMLQSILATGNRDEHVESSEMLQSLGNRSPEFRFSRGSSVFLNDFIDDSSPDGSPTPNMPSNPNIQPYSVSFSSYTSNITNTTPRTFYCTSPPGSQGNASPSNVPSFSDSLKSKFSAASSKCKESITKGTRGLKEKLLLNNSVKELGKEVHREMNASITGVARIFERLDIKRSRSSVSESDCCASTSNLIVKGKTLYCDESASSQSNTDITHKSNCAAPSFASPEVTNILETQDEH